MHDIRWRCAACKILSRIGEGLALLLAAVIIGVIFFGIPLAALEGIVYLRSLEIFWVDVLVGSILILGFVVICAFGVRDIIRAIRKIVNECRVGDGEICQ